MMNSEWLKVMLDEIARKKAEAEQERIEDEKRQGVNHQDGDQPGVVESG